MNHYNFWGLRLAANEHWSALAPFRSPAGAAPADVTIRTRAVRLTDPATQVAISPGHASIQVAGVGRYLVSAGDSIEVTPAASARRAALEVFLFGSAWGALCYQRGLLPLHASVAQVGGGAVVFWGPSGSGKSSLVAWLNQHGHPLLGDDLCRCDPQTQPSPLVWPSLPRLKLWAPSLRALGVAARGLRQDLLEEDKFHWQPAALARPEPLPLRAIYLLEWGDLRQERLTGARALSQFVAASAYRAGQLEAMGLLGWYWQACASLLRRAPVYRLSRPRDWACMPALRALIESEPSRRS